MNPVNFAKGHVLGIILGIVAYEVWRRKAGGG